MSLYELIKKAKNGDKESLFLIIKKFEKYIYSKCVRTYVAGFNLEDIYQECVKELINAIYKYDLKKGDKPIVSYLTRSIENCPKMLIRKYVNKPVCTSLNIKVQGDEELPEILDMLADEKTTEEIILNREEKKKLYEAINSIPQKEKDIILNIYFYNVKIKDYASKNNMSAKYLSKIKKRALERLRTLLDSRY